MTISAWKEIPNQYFKEYGDNFSIFYMNIDNVKHLSKIKTIPEFYLDIVKIWIEVGGGKRDIPRNNLEILMQPLWGNHFIKHKGKLLINTKWVESSIRYIRDMIDDNGKISENVILNKLKNKTNWISELITLKQAIPKEWLIKLQNNLDWKFFTINKKETLRIRYGKLARGPSMLNW